jgi:hypothetical protein
MQIVLLMLIVFFNAHHVAIGVDCVGDVFHVVGASHVVVSSPCVVVFILLIFLNIVTSVYHVVHVHHVDVDVDRVVIIGVHHVIFGVHCVASPHHVVANVHRNHSACLVTTCVHCVIVSVHQLC